MKRPNAWLPTIVLLLVAVVGVPYTTLRWVAPQYLTEAIHQFLGGEVAVSRFSVSPPFTATLLLLRLLGNTPESAASVQRVTVTPRWLSLPKRALWVSDLQLEQPVLRLTHTQAGTTVWPTLPLRAPDPDARRFGPLQQLHLDSIGVVDGVIDFIDYSPGVPFHGLIDHLSLMAGPVAVPKNGSETSFAVRGRVIGHGGHAALMYCSGWVDPTAKDMQASCQLDPLPLAAFEPYFRHGPQVRPYGVTLKSTSQWMAKANQLNADIQVELNNLAEGDLSIRGRTIVDVQRMTHGREPRLRGSFHIEGPLDRPDQWHANFVPGDQPVQLLIERLLEHGIKIIRLPLFFRQVSVQIAPSGTVGIQDIDAASREIQEALEILSEPLPGEEAPPVLEPAVEPIPEAPPISAEPSPAPAGPSSINGI